MENKSRENLYRKSFKKLGVQYPFEFKDEKILSLEERKIYQSKLRNYKAIIDCAYEEGLREVSERMKQLNTDLNQS